MVEKLKEGLVFKINKNTEKNYVILTSTKNEDIEYALVTEINGKIDLEKNTVENSRIDITKTFMIEYNPKTNLIEYSFENNIMKELSKRIPLEI